MVLKPPPLCTCHNIRFENDVKMYGTQTEKHGYNQSNMFENDVKMYGTQTNTCCNDWTDNV